MQKRQANRLKMYEAIKALLNNYKVLWSNFAPVAKVFEELEALLEEIDRYDQIATTISKGVATGKNAQRTKLIDLTIEMLAMLCALEAQSAGKKIAAKIDYSRTELVKMRDFNLQIVCKGIVTVATDEKERLEDFGIDTSEIEALKQEVDLFANSVPSVRQAIATRKVANERLKELFAQTDDLLKNQLDRLMLHYKQLQPEFYISYKSSRHVINYGVRHKKGKSEEKTTQTDSTEETTSNPT